MAEEPQTSLPAWPGLRDWLRIFDGAKMALHPAKLGLALAALVLTFSWGWILDLAWTSSDGGVTATALTDYIEDSAAPTQAPAAAESADAADHGICELWCENTVKHADSAMGSLVTLDFAGAGGFCGSVGMICSGTGWVVKKHAFFAILFFLGGLVIWSFFGAAICRIAAVQFARDDKIGISEALQFTRRRFVSGFLMSPLLPIGILAVIALLLVIGGFFLWIPAIGNAFSLLFFLAILGGLAMAFVVIGSVGGGSFFWPTVAVEGSDGFDAISRSFSYFFGRPVKTVLYGLTALVWGGICWFVLKFILFLTLRITHACVSFGGMDKLDRLWPTPVRSDLYQFGDTAQMYGWEIFAAIMIAIFVFLAIGMLWAFLASYYFSSSTIIYYLLRRDVDATDYEDVYIEEAEGADEPLTKSAPPGGGAAEPSEEGVSLPVIPSPAEPSSAESAPSPEPSAAPSDSEAMSSDESPPSEPEPPEPKPPEPGSSESETTEQTDKET